ncbi:flagellin [Magnetospirillum fulvum]|uniref:Flagellin N-terminal helical region n=1 Tax=Magnetospirillum fulvum TaxID=1082 RepID=A0A1H6IKI6_MAGFU|nr:flagellin [Magnetospirillum fulvum]SEH49131.1 flagellin N-terminal helical region [Magnetospirillum fulvum]
MDRISTYGASQLYISRIMQTQVRMQKEQLQSTTGYVTEDYSGIALDARTAINLENSTALADAFMAANASVQVRQNAANTALTAAQTSINTLKNRLISFASGQMKDQTAIRDVQDVAMRTLTELQSSLNTSVDGEYLFAGGRKDTMPVNFPVTKLADFQKMFDGSMTTYPTLRGADLLDIHLTNRDTGAVSFDSSSGLIIPANAGAYAKVPSSSYVHVSGTAQIVGGVTVSNDGDLTIKGHALSNTGRTPLVETSDAGSGTFLTLSNGSVINTTGALSFSYDKDGQMVVSPATGNSLTTMVPGTRFTISGSDATIATTSATDTTKLVGTNFYTYNGNATSATGLTISRGDDLVLVNNNNTLTFTATETSTMADVVNWINAQVDSSVPAPSPAIAKAMVDNQGRLTISNLNGSSGSPISVRGALSGVLGIGGTVPVGAGAVGSAGTPVVGTSLLTGAVAQTATSLGTPPIAVGDTLTVQVGAAAPATLTVTANTTLTDIARFIQLQDPSTRNADGSLNTLGAQVGVSGGAMTVTNNNGSGNGYTLGGNVAAALGLTGAIADGAATTGSAQPSLNGNYDGSFIVTKFDNVTGKMTIANDTTPSQSETLDATAVTLKRDTGVDGIPDTIVPTGLTTGSATFTLSGDTVTMTLPSGGTDLSTVYSVGQPVTIGGTDNHNGTYEVSAVTANTISYKINTDMLRVGPFLAQSGRTDMKMSFSTTVKPLDTKDTSPDVPGTISSGVATLDQKVFGGLSFTSAGKIVSSVKDALLDSKNMPYPPVGTLITLKGDSDVNAGVYEVTANDGTTLNIRCKTLKTETAMPQTEMTAQSWYKGDTLSLNTSINQTTTIETSLTASDSAFEKVIRACGIIAQGAYGTAGGLDQHPERVEQAIALLKDALSHSSTTPMPFGKEEASDLDGLQKKVGLNLSAIQNSNTALTQMKSFFVNRVSDIEQISSTEAITALLADSQALQTSYQALAKMQQMSLINFLK